MLEKSQTEKVTFKITQGHWQCSHLISHIRFSIIFPWQLCFYLAPFLRDNYLLPKIEMSLDSEHIPFAVSLRCLH